MKNQLYLIVCLLTINLSAQKKTINSDLQKLIKTEFEKSKAVENKKKATEIVFGQTGSFSGSFKTYGEMIKHAIDACFKATNDSGKLNDIKLRLESLNDKGKAHLAAKNIKKLYKKNKIDMFLGCMGTRGVLKVLPMIKNGEIAMFFPWGGDKKLMQPDLTYQINGLGLTYPQTSKLIDYIVDGLRMSKIGIFHSDGNFSKQTANTAIEQLSEFGINPIKTASYNRFTMNITSPAKKLLQSDPKVVLCLATSMPTAKLINYFFEKGHFGTMFFGIDSTLFVGDILKDKGVKFEYASSVPDPENKELAIVQEYQTNLKKYYPDESFNILSLAYYIQAKIIVEAMKTIYGPITKEKILAEIEKMQNFDLGGFKINFDPLTRYAFGQNIIMIKG